MHSEWLRSNLVCPRDRTSLTFAPDSLTCERGHTYPNIDGIPILLMEEARPTLGSISATIEAARTGDYWDGPLAEGQIDPFVQSGIVNKCGNLYRPLIDRLPRYPIPELPLPSVTGQLFLDIGCGWGRWCLAAARKGYTAIGIDAGLHSILAARRVSRQLGLPVVYMVGDARSLPFRDALFDTAFSYSVLQHFADPDLMAGLREIARVLKPGASSLIQMAAAWGIRAIYRRTAIRVAALARQSAPQRFAVRYRSTRKLRQAFAECIGPSRITADGFFGLNLQEADIDLLPARYRLLVRASTLLKGASLRAPLLTRLADSVFVSSRRSA